jgi:hypothetical protein
MQILILFNLLFFTLRYKEEEEEGKLEREEGVGV